MKRTLEQRIAILERLVARNSNSCLEARRPARSMRIITKETAASLARIVKEYLEDENARVTAKLAESGVDGDAEVKVVLTGEEHKYYFTSDMRGHYQVFTYDGGRLGDELGRFDELDEAAEAIADHARDL
jgi:predicted methyltransferase MtxX (methanogen marker protein 4)